MSLLRSRSLDYQLLIIRQKRYYICRCRVLCSHIQQDWGLELAGNNIYLFLLFMWWSLYYVIYSQTYNNYPRRFLFDRSQILWVRLKVRMRGIQVDNQLPLTPTPVLFRPQRVGQENDYVLKFSLTQQSNGSLDLCAYPYIGFQVSRRTLCSFLKVCSHAFTSSMLSIANIMGHISFRDLKILPF